MGLFVFEWMYNLVKISLNIIWPRRKKGMHLSYVKLPPCMCRNAAYCVDPVDLLADVCLCV